MHVLLHLQNAIIEQSNSDELGILYKILKNKFLSQRFLCEFRIGSLKSSARLGGAFEDFSGEIIPVLATYIRHFHSAVLPILSQIWRNIFWNMEKYCHKYGEIIPVLATYIRHFHSDFLSIVCQNCHKYFGAYRWNLVFNSETSKSTL